MNKFTTYPAHKFGKASEANLAGVMPGLVSVARLAITLCEFDGTVIAGGGLRTAAQAQANFEAGTGIKDSRHLKQPDGWGHAIDLLALIDVDKDGDGDKVMWARLDAFRAMAIAVKRASAILGIPIRQGCDWNMNGTFGETKEWDWPHFESPIAFWQQKAEAAMLQHQAQLVAAGYDVRPESYPIAV